MEEKQKVQDSQSVKLMMISLAILSVEKKVKG